MPLRIGSVDIGASCRIVRDLAVGAVMSPLRRYVLYSIAFHVILVAVCSIGMLFPEAPKIAAKGQKGAPAKKAATGEKGKPSAPAQTPEGKPVQAPDATKPTGDKADYYRREGIDDKPAKPSQIPKGPLEAKDELDKALEDLE